ncbi:MAG: hypothetical protein QNJ54_31630 [Prochloraceae cyanobacterium]|nr:hypothetical protein [Prochloraceae cyanobacterium]
MSRISNVVTKYVKRKETGASRKQSIAPEANQEFSRMEASGRIIRSYSGFLPSTRFQARHILRCEHLRQLPGERFQPYRTFPNYTHQLWLWYRLNSNPDKLYLLFRGQFDFTIPGKNSDKVAAEITDFIAYLLKEQENSSRELFRHKDSDNFWVMAIENEFKRLSSS